jgi:hypothetical protein
MAWEVSWGMGIGNNPYQTHLKFPVDFKDLNLKM